MRAHLLARVGVLWLGLGGGLAWGEEVLEDAGPDEVLAQGEPVAGDAIRHGPNRNGPPPVLPPEPMELHEPVEVTLGAHQRLLYVHVAGVRRVQVIVSLHEGARDLVGTEVEVGQLLGQQWSESSTRYRATELEIALDRQDAWLDGWVDQHDTGLRLEVARDNLDQAAEIMRTVLAEPLFDKGELKRTQRQTRLWLTREAVYDPGTVAGRALHFGWMPADHPRGRRPDLGSYGSVRNAQLEDLAARVRAGAEVTVLVVGDLSQEQSERVARKLVDGLGGEALGTPAPEQLVLRVLGGAGGIPRGTLPPDGAVEDEAVNVAQIPAAVHQFTREPFEQFGMRGRLALQAEVTGRADDATAKMPTPKPVHDDTGGQWPGSLFHIREPQGERGAVGAKIARCWFRIGLKLVAGQLQMAGKRLLMGARGSGQHILRIRWDWGRLRTPVVGA